MRQGRKFGFAINQMLIDIVTHNQDLVPSYKPIILPPHIRTPKGRPHTKRMDMEGKKRFMKLEFMDAAEELGMFNKQKVSEDNKSDSNK